MGHGYRPSSGSISMAPGAQRPGSQPQHERSFSLGSRANQPIAPSQQQFASRASVQQQPIPSSKFNGSLSSQGPPQLGTLSFQNPAPQQPQQQPQQPQQPPHFQSQQQQLQQQGGMGTNPLQQHPPSHGSQPRQQSPPQRAPPRPVFGLTLSRLYERDALAVPMVVYQCIQAVDLYGLGVEGIYRLSGSLPHVNKLKNMFDTGKYLLNCYCHELGKLTEFSRLQLQQSGLPKPGEFLPRREQCCRTAQAIFQRLAGASSDVRALRGIY